MSEQEATELYRRYRPSSLKEVVGQQTAIKTLVDLGKRKAIPHAILFSGPSGCGKTTIARILADKMNCKDTDLQEVDMGKYRGIDTVREIGTAMMLAPFSGESRVYIMDEVHQITGQAADSMLKMLEDTPSHVYFFLCTTDPQKLKTTIRTRCTEIKLTRIADKDLAQLVQRTAEAEGKQLAEEVIDKIVEVADGSARKALVLLHAAIGQESVEDQLAAVARGDYKSQAIELARLLLPGKGKRSDWKSIAKILEGIEDDPEQIRQVVLGYAKSGLLKGWANAGAAYTVLDVFRKPFWEAGQGGAATAALVAACWEVFSEAGQ